MPSANAPRLRFLGPTSDQRSNLWEVTCVCGIIFTPASTMYALQTVQCPRCNVEMRCRYNDCPPTIVVYVEPA